MKFTVLFKNKEIKTQKHTKRIEIQQSQITNHDFLFPKRIATIVKARKRRFFRFWLTSQKNSKFKDVFGIAGRMLQGCQTPTSSNIANWWGVGDRWRHNARHMTSLFCWNCNIWPNIGLLSTNHIIAYITMAYRRLQEPSKRVMISALAPVV